MKNIFLILLSFGLIFQSCSDQKQSIKNIDTIFLNNLNSLDRMYSSLENVIEGRVVRVKDGDTIVILTSDMQQITIRVKSVDCPERRQPYGKKAKDFVIDQIAGKDVRITNTSQDRYGRTIGFVKYKDKDLSEELLKEGLAWHYIKYSKDLNLQELENQARKNKIGLWSNPSSIEPWLYRKNN